MLGMGFEFNWKSIYIYDVCVSQNSLKKTYMDYIIIVCEIVAFGQIKVEMKGENTKKKQEKGGPKKI